MLKKILKILGLLQIVKFVWYEIVCEGLAFFYSLRKNFMKHPKMIWLFGSWLGKTFSDNPKYLYLYVLRNHPEITPIWVSRSDSVIAEVHRLGGKAVKRDSFKAHFYSLVSDAVFVTHQYYYDVIDYLPKTTLKVFLGHGMPLKKISLNSYEAQKMLETNLAITTSVVCQEAVSFAFSIPLQSIAVTGQPRADILFKKYDKQSILNEQIVNESSTIITYLPTFRKHLQRDDASPVILNLLKSEALRLLLDRYNAVWVMKEHNRYLLHDSSLVLEKDGNETRKYGNRIIKYPSLATVDVQELLNITDILITDYSSCYIDFLLLKRPIIFYCYDLKSYEQDQGFFYKYEDVTPGPKVFNGRELMQAIEAYLKDPSKDLDKREEICNFFHQYKNGQSSERIFRMIFEKTLKR